MSQANPYEAFLDGRPATEILGTTAGTVAELLEAIGSAKATEQPAPGKWSVTEILSHLADCELVFAFRLRQTLAEDGPTIQPFDQDKWAWTGVYSAIPARLALDTFTALRAWNLQLIERALPGAASRTMTHPERGALTFQTFIELIAGHDLNHLGQLKKIAGR